MFVDTIERVRNCLDKMFYNYPTELFVSLMLLNLPYLGFIFIKKPLLQFIAAFERGIFAGGMACIFIAFIRHLKLKKSLQYIVTLISIVTFGIDVYSIYQYGHPFNAGMFEIVISTNHREATEYLTSYITIYHAVILVLAVITIIFITVQITKRINFEKKKLVSFSCFCYH